MKILRLSLLALGLCVCAAAQCGSGGYAVVVNKANPTDSLSMAQLRKLMMGDVRSWPDHKPVFLVTRDASTDVGKCVLSTVVRMSEAEYHRYLMSVEFRGEETVPSKKVDSSVNAARVVAAAAGGIAVVEPGAVAGISSIVKVVKLNGKQPGEPGYPL